MKEHPARLETFTPSTDFSGQAFSGNLVFTLLGSEDLGRLTARILHDNFLCDLYARLAPWDRRISRNIVLIDLGRLTGARTDRRLLARTINRCFQAGAAAIGVDIHLEAPQPGDEVLAASLQRAAPRVVLVRDLKRPLLCRTFSQIPGLRTGMGNFLVTTQDPVIRQAKLWWGRSQEHEGFGAAILRAAGLGALLEAVPSEASGRLRLKFPPGDPTLVFPVLKVQDLLEASPPPDLNGQLVLIGNLSPAARREDNYRTPVGELPGLYLHAIALETLIQGKFIRTPPAPGKPGPGSGPGLFFAVGGLIAPLVPIFRHRTRKSTWLLLVGLMLGLPLIGYFAFTYLYLILPAAALNVGVLVLGFSQLRRLRLDLDQHFQALSAEHADCLAGQFVYQNFIFDLSP